MKKYFRQLSVPITAFILSALPAFAATTQDNLSKQPGIDLTVDSLFRIIKGLACWGTRFITVIMVIVIVWYGFQMMVSQGNETKFKDAKKSLGYAVIGMIVILGAYTIIATVGNAVQGVGAGDLSTRSPTFLDYTPLGACSN